MRCPQCNKFAAEDTDAEPEIREEWDGTAGVIEARIVNTCVECSTELKEGNLSVEFDFEEQIKAHIAINPDCAEKKEFTIEVHNPGRTDRQETRGKNGRPIKPRYQKRYYGFEATVELTCGTCGQSVHSEDISDEIQASGMDELG